MAGAPCGAARLLTKSRRNHSVGTPACGSRPIADQISVIWSAAPGTTSGAENPSPASLRMLELEIPVPGAIGEDASARSLLMRLPGAHTAAWAGRLPNAFALLARRVWRLAIGKYTSASS